MRFKAARALCAPPAWTASGARGAGTVHLGVDLDGLTGYAADLARRRIPEQPFIHFGQMTTFDPSRSPAGTESAWGYTHLPIGVDLNDAVIAAQVDLVEQTLERHAPGFVGQIVARHVQSPEDLRRANPNLVHGSISGGTSQLHQQLVFRPVPGLSGAATPIDRLFLAGSSAHPGGGVHGSAGANAARAALVRASPTGALSRQISRRLFERIYR